MPRIKTQENDDTIHIPTLTPFSLIPQSGSMVINFGFQCRMSDLTARTEPPRP